jgi:PERQ amino acid-rich with GYF domain-containing protein
VEIIADSIYASSQTLDGRGLAQEFVRRKKLMDKGIVEPAPQADLNGTEGKSTGGGWSEVAKKGPEKEKKEEPATQFKVVAGKKKTKR